MKKEDVNKLYSAAWFFIKNNPETTLNIENKVYYNLLEALYNRLNSNPLFSDDIMTSCTEKFLLVDSEKERISDNQGEELVAYISDTLKLNKKKHYLLIPLNGAKLSSDIQFDMFNFIVGNESEKEEKILRITNLKKSDVHFFIEHTKKSRSKDFMMNPMIVMQIDNIHSNVYYSASSIAKIIFQIMRI